MAPESSYHSTVDRKNYDADDMTFLACSSCDCISPAASCLSKALRNIIAKSPPSSPEAEAKAGIIDKINEFINIRITLAAAEIGKNAITKIREGDVILTYGRYAFYPDTVKFRFPTSPTVA